MTVIAEFCLLARAAFVVLVVYGVVRSLTVDLKHRS